MGVLGVTVGMLIQGYLSNSNTTNQNQSANITTVNQTNSTTQGKSQDNFISASKAISVVKQNEEGQSGNVRYSATLVKNSNNPYYRITVYDNDPESEFYGEDIGGAKVDAKTGEFLGGMG
ncbi:MAG: PepSY domain-containing protein [Methanobacterium sp. ERen5]|nr:MAG: PepSY domain-containing protein [Methanobacterium sp. ERen5]